MNKIELIHKLAELDRRGVYVLPRRDIEKLFPLEGAKALEKSLQRMVADGLLQRVTRGLYLNPAAHSKNRWVIEDIAKALRPACISYVSLESMLSEYGLISQIPIDRITIMTTGRSGEHLTPYGVIEFTHTQRSHPDIIKRTLYMSGRPLRVASKATAIRDLRRVGRNVNMLESTDPDDDGDDA